MSGPYETAELRVERAVAAPRDAEVARQMDRLTGLIDQAEKALVGVLDARGHLEDRIQPVLRPSSPDSGTIAAWADEQEQRTVLGGALMGQCRRLEQLIDSMGIEEQRLRDIAGRVEL